ncbi:MAG TPA: HAMP domain-containing sensor histidine kinase [Gemmatimonadaceae bacterium]|jgi:signal transduction histidine kinase|nr:HAMP domain-containing sensor histidine kinase [Gemmatimonadaceae bacterium]
MTLRSRLVIGLVTIAVILVGPLVFAVSSLFRLRTDALQLRETEIAALIVLGRLRDGLNDLRREELALLFSRDIATSSAMDRELYHADRLADTLAHYNLPSFASDIATSIHLIAAAAPSEARAAINGDTKLADSLSANAFVPALNRADSVVRAAEQKVRERTSQRVDDETTRIAYITSASFAALLLAIALAAIISLWLTRTISQPIFELRSGMRAVADGDLEYRLKGSRSRTDEFGQLATSFDEMTRQLAELDKLKAEFVSVASHELKTPINVIIGYLQLLEEGVYGRVDPKQHEVHRTLATQANVLLRLVKQLLDVSRFEAGGGRLEPRAVSLNRLVSDLERAFHVLALQREIDFRVEREEGLPDEVVWDADRINEVLGNLLSNAFKFTPHGGTVELILEPVDDDAVLMRVHDTGAGIPPEQLPRIFEKFYQADNQRSARAAGSGLGLAIAKQIVEAHGGSILCESTPGVGTTFSIALPTRVMGRHTAQRPQPVPV